jgi:TetR/AcrR family transcriptional regulator
MAEKEMIPELSDKTARKRLLAGAMELFTRKGYAATTVREIIAAAGVSKPVLYYYFQNKEGIYLELIKEAFNKFMVLLDTFRNEPGTPAEKLLSLSDAVFSLFLQNMDVTRIIFSIYYGPPQGAPFFDFDAFHFKLRDLIHHLLEEGVREGDFRIHNLEEATYAILGAVDISIHVELFHPERGLKKEGLRNVLTIILRGISSGSVKPKGEEER